MSGKTKLDIVKDGLIAYYDAGNTLSNIISGSSVSSILTIPAVSRNIAKNYEKLYSSGKSDFLVAKDSSAPTYQSNNYGVWNFNGINYLSFWPEETFELDTNIESFTFSFWFYVNTIPTSYPYTIITIIEPQVGRYWTLNIEQKAIGTTLAMYISDESNLLGFLDGEFEIGKWYNFVIVNYYNASTLFYINGILNTKATEQFVGKYYPLYIGTSIDANINFFEGKISNFMVHKGALTGNQILQNYNALAYRFSNQIGQLIIP